MQDLVDKPMEPRQAPLGEQRPPPMQKPVMLTNSSLKSGDATSKKKKTSLKVGFSIEEVPELETENKMPSEKPLLLKRTATESDVPSLAKKSF